MQYKPQLTSEDAGRILQAAKSEAVSKGARVSIAIVDAAGDLMAFDRLDGAIGPSCTVAIEKARTAALWKRDTLYWEKRLIDKPTYASFLTILPLRAASPWNSNPIASAASASRERRPRMMPASRQREPPS